MKDDTMDNQQVTETQLAWLAGIFDGEGTFSMCRSFSKKSRQFQPRCSIVNSSPTMIIEIMDILKKIGVGFYMREKKYEKSYGNKQMWFISIQTFLSVKRLIESVEKYLIAKKPHAKILLDFVNSRNGKKHFNNEMKEYTPEELTMVNDLIYLNGNQRNRNLNDHTPEFAMMVDMIWSELRGKLAEVAEMSTRH